jgi:hypothetical protein
MNEDEKSRQVGDAVAAYQAAKTELTRIELEISGLSSAHSGAADALLTQQKAYRGSPLQAIVAKLPSVAIALDAAFNSVVSLIGGACRLSDKALTALLAERDAARASLEAARALCADLGVNCLS